VTCLKLVCSYVHTYSCLSVSLRRADIIIAAATSNNISLGLGGTVCYCIKCGLSAIVQSLHLEVRPYYSLLGQAGWLRAGRQEVLHLFPSSCVYLVRGVVLFVMVDLMFIPSSLMMDLDPPLFQQLHFLLLPLSFLQNYQQMISYPLHPHHHYCPCSLQ
jgi:hypothetical protein